MTIADILIEGVETAGPHATAEALALRMEEAGVGSIVIEEEMQPVGIVTDRDLAMRVDARGGDASEVTAADVMTPDPATMPVEAGILQLTDAMQQAMVRRMPIVDDQGTLVGIVTLDDVMRLLATELYDLASVVQAESPPY
ncbi:CBS domain-containing protein [Halobacteriales archaeon Cl-PHB]